MHCYLVTAIIYRQLFVSLLPDQYLFKDYIFLMSGSVKVGIAFVSILVAFLAWNYTSTDLNDSSLSSARLLQYTTSDTRTYGMGRYCPAGANRDSLIDQGELEDGTRVRERLEENLGIDGNQLIYRVSMGREEQAYDMVQEDPTFLIFYVVTYIVGFCVFMLIWPFLCCFCTCPAKCPPACIRKDESEPYSRCELLWPAITLCVIFVFLFVACVQGMVWAGKVDEVLSKVACSASMVTDNLLNGNVTNNGTAFFVGLNEFSNQLTNLQSNLTNLQTNFSDLASTAATSTSKQQVDKVQAVMDSISMVPDGSSTAALSLVYDNPINAGGQGTVNSTFPGVLGTYTTVSTLVGTLYSLVSSLKSEMQTIKDNAWHYDNTANLISTEISSINSSLVNMIKEVNEVDNDLMGPLLEQYADPQEPRKGGIIFFFSVGITSVVAGIAGVILTAFLQRHVFRYLLYCSCVGICIGTFYMFIAAVTLSVVLPMVTWGCSYAQTTLGSDSGFQRNIAAITDNATAQALSVCMPYGTGNLVNQVTINSGNGLNNLSDLIINMDSFNSSYHTSAINTNLETFINSVRQYSKGEVSDLDATNNDILNTLATSSNYNSGCNAQLLSDSWTPSNSQDTSQSTYIACTDSSGNVGDRSTCTSTLTNSGGSTCGGCMDTTLLMTYYPTSADSTTLSTDLNNRYSAGCAFSTELSNIWSRYYQVKNAKLGPNDIAGGTSVLGRSQQVVIDTNGTATSSVFSAMSTFNTQIQSIQTSVSSISELTDPSYGMLVGLNCRVFGQDLDRFKNVFCGEAYEDLYYWRLFACFYSFVMLLSLCCLVCTGVRHYKHMEREMKVVDTFAKGKEDVISVEESSKKDGESFTDFKPQPDELVSDLQESTISKNDFIIQ